MGDVSLGYSRNQNEEMAIPEAAAAGLKTMDDLIRAVSKQNQQMDCRGITDSAVSTFRTVMSNFNRTGHARFRRAPVQPELAQGHSPPHTLELLSGSREPPATALGGLGKGSGEVMDKEWFCLSTSGNSSSTPLSSITGEGSVSNGKGGAPAASLLDSSALAVCIREPPCPGKRSREQSHNHNHSGTSLCHCKKKKSRVKKSIRVPAISSKIADIPADEYSWRKYGQKPIKNSPYPRGYYKCSTVRGCPAKKHVERANDDPAMLIVTYAGEHLHTQPQLTVVESATL
ncbi:putative WRKY transcription factor 11-like [Dorcoceras hygrometricum]|uniref:Putative WRKY transcription factor 11-like n=1 Tax=Dorcoceras hygrometricum TaxID=472368 RepID=A0A2Z7AZW2_9LAMI|nr:putative WRKY transcription factor 11-like [Dorcoceras hygrometricum]